MRENAIARVDFGHRCSMRDYNKEYHEYKALFDWLLLEEYGYATRN
jgi:hypothetical protein